MSKPLKKHDHHAHSEHKPKHRLTLVHGKTKHHKKNSFKPIWVFLGVFLTVLTSIVMFTTKHSIDLDLAVGSLSTLHDVYRQEGLQRFLEEKKRLKDKIAKTLKDPSDDEEEIIASNVAVYLFPDVLPDWNLEKSVASEQWAGLQEAIEKSPRTPESRLWFEEMRANIWNYENPDRVFPKVSNYAKEALKIYDELSSP